MEYDVIYTVKFLTKVKVEPGQSLSDAVADIDIPESGLGSAGSYYKTGSFEVLSITDDKGNDVTDQLDDEEDAE